VLRSNTSAENNLNIFVIVFMRETVVNYGVRHR